MPNALQQMGLGQRGAEPNPKLAKYGWFETTENDEWWNDTPKASMPSPATNVKWRALVTTAQAGPKTCLSEMTNSLVVAMPNWLAAR